MVVGRRRRVAFLGGQQKFDHVATEAVLTQQRRARRPQAVRSEVVDAEVEPLEGDGLGTGRDK